MSKIISNINLKKKDREKAARMVAEYVERNGPIKTSPIEPRDIHDPSHIKRYETTAKKKIREKKESGK